MRAVLLITTLVFIAIIAVLTFNDIRQYGLTGISVLAIIVLVLFTTGVVGALRNPPGD